MASTSLIGAHVHTSEPGSAHKSLGVDVDVDRASAIEGSVRYSAILVSGNIAVGRKV
jgi:hypothetical protein